MEYEKTNHQPPETNEAVGESEEAGEASWPDSRDLCSGERCVDRGLFSTSSYPANKVTSTVKKQYPKRILGESRLEKKTLRIKQENA